MSVRFRPKLKRASASRLGIKDDRMDAIEEASDEDGKVDINKLYPKPPETEATSEQKTVLKILGEKGYETDEFLYKKEYQLRVAHQLLINGGSTGQIAQKLGISAGEARKLKVELSARLINEVKSLDKNKVAGQAIMFYDHIMAKSLQLVNKANDSQIRTQVEALKVALQAQTDKQKFLTMAGFWNNPLAQGQANYDSHIEGASDLRDMLTGIISGDTVEVFPDDEDDSDGIDLL